MRPTESHVARRRLLGVVFVVAVIGVGVWAATAAVRTDGKKAEPAATTTPSPAAPPKPLRIIFPEGFTREQMAERIRAVKEIARRKRGIEPALSPKRYLAATASSPLPGRFAGDGKPRSLEGFLFPASYDFFAQTTSRQLVGEQLKVFKSKWATVDLRYARSKNLTPYDVLIIASMVEKEVVVPRERKLVAAVIYNRLHARMPLGIDATLRYGLHIPPTKAITKSQLESDSPYNTRKFLGLPPPPIANPGLPSIEAAAHPARVNYLYFVRKADCKSHYFTASEQEFLSYPRAGLQC